MKIWLTIRLMLKKNGNSCKRIPKSMYAFHVNELQNITIQLAQ